MIDFHCHLDLYQAPRAIVEECITRGAYVLSVTTTPSAWAGTLKLSVGADRIRTALGLHPQLAHEREHELELFERLLPQARYVGEVGLDGAPEFRKHQNTQLRVFTRILNFCRSSGGRIVSIHSRQATTPVLDQLECYKEAGTFVLHWFSGNKGELERAIKLGCWFSVGPAMLNSNKGREFLAVVPRDRILTESDGPFARINGRQLLPWDAWLAVESLSSVWGVQQHSVEEILLENLRSLVR